MRAVEFALKHTHIMSTHVFNAIRHGPTTSFRIASSPSRVILTSVPPNASPPSRWTISNFARTYTSRAWWSAASAVGCALMFPGFMTSMATLLTRR